jgi:hypothetical protein
MIEINGSKCICTYSRNKILMNRRTIFYSGMAIVTVSIFFGSGHMIGNEKVFAFGGFGHGFLGHGFGHGFLGHGIGHFYGPGFGYSYGPGYVIDNPCDGGPYSIIDGQAVCTTG